MSLHRPLRKARTASWCTRRTPGAMWFPISRTAAITAGHIYGRRLKERKSKPAPTDGKPDEADADAGEADASPANIPKLSTSIADDYVPVGARSFTVTDATGFKAGDHVLLHWSVTPE